jgi:hypothetical protein
LTSINLFSGDSYDKRPVLPTLRQYLKQSGKKKLAKRYPVWLIWEPTNFPNWTFETEYFRVRIKTNSDLSEAISQQFEEWVLSEPLLAIADIDKSTASFSIVSMDGEVVRWVRLGNSGYRMEHV